MCHEWPGGVRVLRGKTSPNKNWPVYSLLSILPNLGHKHYKQTVYFVHNRFFNFLLPCPFLVHMHLSGCFFAIISNIWRKYWPYSIDFIFLFFYFLSLILFFYFVHFPVFSSFSFVPFSFFFVFFKSRIEQFVLFCCRFPQINVVRDTHSSCLFRFMID